MGFPWNQGSFSAGVQETVESEEFHDLEAPCLTRHTGLARSIPSGTMDQANGGPFCVVIAQDFRGMGGKLPSFQGVGGKLPNF